MSRGTASATSQKSGIQGDRFPTVILSVAERFAKRIVCSGEFRCNSPRPRAGSIGEVGVLRLRMRIRFANPHAPLRMTKFNFGRALVARIQLRKLLLQMGDLRRVRS